IENGLIERKQMLGAKVMTQKAWHRTECTGMGMRLKKGTIERELVTIKAKTCPGLLESKFQVVLAGDEVERAGACLITNNEVDECIEWKFFLRFRDLLDRLTVKFFQSGIHYSRDHHSRPAAAPEK